MNYTDLAREVLLTLNRMEDLQVKMAKQLEEMYYDTDPPPQHETVTRTEETLFDVTHDEATIKRLGQRIAYNLIDDTLDVARFKDFIYEAKTKPRLFTEMELKYIDIADKNFDDIRLSRKHLGILQTVYTKLYSGKAWPFKVKQGYMYKYEDAMHWEFF